MAGRAARFTLLTPPGVGGVAVVEVTGPDRHVALAAILEDAGGGPVRLVRVRGADGTVVDRALRVEPPGGESIELHLHGSRGVLAAVEAAVGGFDGPGDGGPASRLLREALHPNQLALALEQRACGGFAALRSRLDAMSGTARAAAIDAARIVLEHQDPAQWRERALTERDPQAAVLALVALCRTGEATRDGDAVAMRLAALEPAVRGTPVERSWLRACELCLIRLAPVDGSLSGADALRTAVEAHFPAGEGVADASELDMHRAALLVKLGSPRAVEVTVALLEKPDVRRAPEIDAALLARGGPYGKAVADMIANAPATQKIGLVHAVRDAKVGWTPDNRMRFSRAIAGLRKASGGNSFAGFLNRMGEEFIANAPEADREFLAQTSAGRSMDEPAVAPRGPGRAWTVEELVALGPKLSMGRDHREGMRAYRAAQCAQCHRAGGIGGSGGPELSGVSRRFS
ncbi:MAG: hypothetical protein ACO4CZ_13960, partial [Planctomycetota bacterium]